MNNYDDLNRQFEELEKDIPPVNKDRMFYIKIEDKYQRSYLEYDGIDNMKFRFGGKGSRRVDYIVPPEDIETVVGLVAPLKAYAEEYGFDNPLGYPNHQITFAESIFGKTRYLDDDSKSIKMAADLEAYFFGKNSELKTVYDESVREITQREQSEDDEKQRMFDELSLDTIRNAYPAMFDENGNFTKESIQLLMNLLGQYTSSAIKGEKRIK